VDYFILARLVKRKISPPSEAERRILICRLTFNLTGLEQQLHSCQISSGERRYLGHAVDQLVTNIKNARLSPAEQREQLDLLGFLNRSHLKTREPTHIREMYGEIAFTRPFCIYSDLIMSDSLIDTQVGTQVDRCSR